MVQIAREHFFLDRLEAQLVAERRADSLRIFVEDGAAFLQDGTRGFPRYDAIIVDAFVGREAVPFFASDAGMAAARKRLALGGGVNCLCSLCHSLNKGTQAVRPNSAAHFVLKKLRLLYFSPE